MDGVTHDTHAGEALPAIEPETRDMILHWFEEHELSLCELCGNRHVLPGWGSPNGRMCVTCGPLVVPQAS